MWTVTEINVNQPVYHFDFNMSLTLLPQLAFGDHINRFSIVRNVVRITFVQKRQTEMEVPGSEEPLLEEEANVRDKGTLYSVETVYHYFFCFYNISSSVIFCTLTKNS